MKLFVGKRIHPSLRGREIDDAVLTLTEADAARLEWPLSKVWFTAIWLAAVLVLGLLASRVFFLNVVKGEQYQDMANRNSLRAQTILAPRGIIYDRTGQALVQNVPTFDLAVVATDTPVEDSVWEEERDRLLSLIENVDIDALEATRKNTRRSVTPVTVKSELTQEETLLVLGRQAELPGIVLIKSSKREYADVRIGVHVRI